MTIQIEEGKYYQRADGSVHGPARPIDVSKHPRGGILRRFTWRVGKGAYTNDGCFYADGPTGADLVAEVSNGSLLNDAVAIETVEGPQVAEKPEWAAAVEAEATDYDTGRFEKLPGESIEKIRAVAKEFGINTSEFDAAHPSADIKATIADEAKRIVSGARRSAYGKPEDNFERIARFWDAYFKNTGRDVSITAADVSPLMRLMKEARLCETPDHYDSHVDLAGYTLTGAEVNKVVQPTKAA